MAGVDLRGVMRAVPAPVAVVTVDVEGERLGLTIGSLVSLSLDPPLVAFAVGKHAALVELLRRADSFGISILAAGQDALAQHFARGVPPIGMWAAVETRTGELGAPLLSGAVAWFECRRHAEHDAGDHILFIGEVLVAERGQATEPLVYVDQRYAST